MMGVKEFYHDPRKNSAQEKINRVPETQKGVTSNTDYLPVLLREISKGNVILVISSG